MLAIVFVVATTLLLFWLCARPERLTSVWGDTFKVLPYRGTDGRRHVPMLTEGRAINGEAQYRERAETTEEWWDRQY
jgi:hypothetical protein